MSTCPHGFIEVKHPGRMKYGHDTDWYGVVDLDGILCSNDYEMFHLLFGVRDDTNFEPIVSTFRGLPEDASEAVRTALEIEDDFSVDDFDWVTWISFQDMQAVDWDETALEASAWEYKEGQATGRGMGLRADDPLRIAGLDFEHDGSVWKFRQITRHEALGYYGQSLYDLMEVLAKYHSAEHVRAVVWFD
jgi:hypothetical protein